MYVLPGHIVVPDWNVVTIAMAVLGLLNLCSSGPAEASGKSSTGYSKFTRAHKRTLPTKQAMFLMYLGGLVTSLFALWSSVDALAPVVGYGPGKAGLSSYLSLLLHSAGQSRRVLVHSLLAIHYAKRIIEVLFVHQYSSSTELPVALMVCLAYTLYVLQIWYLQARMPVAAYAKVPLVVGLALFAISELGNLYHHLLLARLRSKPTARQPHVYHVPEGGWFGLVACPHYFFEIVAWFGIAAVSQNVLTFLIAAGMASYLTGRSVATSKWYHQKLDAYPRSRRHIIPYLF